jgi:hypothetical protein
VAARMRSARFAAAFHGWAVAAAERRRLRVVAARVVARMSQTAAAAALSRWAVGTDAFWTVLSSSSTTRQPNPSVLT